MRLGLFYNIHQPTFLVCRYIVLVGVARDHHFAVFSQPREKHQHLRWTAILHFVANDDAVLEGAAAHECQRSNFNDVVIHHPVQLLLRAMLQENVKNRPHPWIHLFIYVAGQEPQFLFFHRHNWARNNYLFDKSRFKAFHGVRASDQGFPRSGRPYRKNQLVFFVVENIHVFLLLRIFCGHVFIAVAWIGVFVRIHIISYIFAFAAHVSGQASLWNVHSLY